MARVVQDAVLMAFLLKAIMHIQLQLHRPEKGLRTTTCSPMTLSTVGDVPRNGLRVNCQRIHIQCRPVERIVTHTWVVQIAVMTGQQDLKIPMTTPVYGHG